MCVLQLWTRFKSALAPSPHSPGLSFEYKPAHAMQWLRRGVELQRQRDRSSAAQAFVAASRLFNDAGKLAQGRAALKLAMEANPGDVFLRAQLRNVWMMSPSLVEELPLPAYEFSEVLGPVAEA